MNGLAVFLGMLGCVVRMSRNCGEVMKIFGMQEDRGFILVELNVDYLDVAKTLLDGEDVSTINRSLVQKITRLLHMA